MPMTKFIQDELYSTFETLRHHNNTTNIIEELDKDEFISIKHDILYLSQLFSFLCDTFENKIIQKMFIDIVSLSNFIDILGSNKQLKIYYDKYLKLNPTKTNSFDKFSSHFQDELKINKDKIILILNTKLYYFDILIWQSALSSIKIIKYLSVFGLRSVKHTKQFIKLNKLNNPDSINNKLQIKYNIQNQNLYIEYSEIEIVYLSSLKQDDDEYEVDTNLAKLLDVKDKIDLFKGMEDEDIKGIVKDVHFIYFNANEIIIAQDASDETVYFILEGSCRVNVGNKGVGSIKKHQIFGEFAGITKNKRTATIRANQPTTLLRFDLAFDKFKNNPYCFAFLYKNITHELIHKITSVNNKQY